MRIKKKNRKFIVKPGITLIHKADIHLRNNEQVTLKDKNKEIDIVKKQWGYYLTPSINKRLLSFNLNTAIIKNTKTNNIFVFAIDKNKMRYFKRYAKKENLKVLRWLNEKFK